MIIVTGASGGLGTALVRELARDDVVVGTYLTTVPEFGDAPVQSYRVDVTDPESVGQFVAAIRPAAKRIVLVNLAGVAVDQLVLGLSLSDWHRAIDASLTGTFLMSQALLRLMMRERWGRIVNIGSVVTQLGTPGTAAYAAAKGGLLPFTRVLAREYARYNVTANCIELGYFDAGLIDQVSEEARRELLGRIPLQRFGRPEEIAETVRYLIRSSYTTGASIPLNGGLT